MKKYKNRSKNGSIGNINFSSDDRSAIICVLPLVLQIETDTYEQSLVNDASCNSAAQKLINHESQLSADEIRVISLAIGAALCFISGTNLEYGFEFDVDAEWREEIKGHFFTLNRLNPIFQNFVEDLMHRYTEK